MPNPIRRRRIFGGAAPFAPPQAGALQLWLRADQGLFSDAAMTTSVTADGTAVGGWADQSGNGHHATQATAGNRPVYKASNLNGQPAVLFAAASSQYLAANGIAAAFSGSNMPGTLLIALKLVTTATGIFLGLGNSGAAAPRWFFDNSTTNWASLRESDAAASTNVVGSGGQADTNPHVVTWVSPGTTMQINMDGTNIVGPSAQSVGTSTLNNGTVGAINLNGALSTFTNANIAELLLWSVALSDGDQAAARRYLESKYRITGS